MKLYAIFTFLFYLISIVSGIIYSRKEPSGSTWLYAGLTENINIPGNQTDWTFLPDCRGSLLSSFCLSNTALTGYTTILRASQFGFLGSPNIHSEYPISGFEIQLFYDSTGTDVTYQFENIAIIDHLGNPSSMILNGTYNQIAICCQTTTLGSSISNWGLNLKASNVNNTNFGVQFNVNRLSGSLVRFPRVYQIGMRVHYQLTININQITPNSVEELLQPTNFTINGVGFITVFNIAPICKVGNTNTSCWIQDSSTVIVLSPVLVSGSYPIEISIDNGTTWTSNNIQLSFTPRALGCSISYVSGVKCDTSGNTIITSSIVVFDNNTHQLSNVIVTEDGNIFAPDAILSLSGNLTINLKNNPINKSITLVPFRARSLSGSFSNTRAISNNTSGCENLKATNNQNINSGYTSLSVIIAIDSSGCQLPIGLIVGIVVGIAIIAILVGVSIRLYNKFAVNVSDKKATKYIKKQEQENLKRELSRASETSNNQLNNN